ncbi:U3 snoRNP protein, partial [Coemansia aciculifera]
MGKKRTSTATLPTTTPSVDSFAQTIPESFMQQYISRPGAFVVPSEAARTAAMEIVGSTYNAANFSDKFGLYDDWNTVLESGFDPSLQIWELINVRNAPVLKYTTDIMKELSQLVDSVNDDDDSDSSASDEENEQDDIVSDSAESEEDAVSAEVSEDESDVASQLDSDAEAASDLDSDSDKDMADGDDDDEEDEMQGSTRKSSVLDDQFFSLAEVEKFADDADEEDMRDRAILAGDYPKPPAGQEDEESDSSDEDDEDDIDMFQDLNALDDDDEDGDSDQEGAGAKVDEMMYTDFFKAPRGSKRGMARASLEKHAKRVKFDPSTVGASDVSEPESEADLEPEQESQPDGRTRNLFADDDDDDADNGSASGAAGSKSEFEKRQEKLQGLISRLEDEAVDKKHWAMTGEVTSAVRPKDSLLEEDLEFDHVQKPVPIVTQEATQTLEDVIKRRILNEEWDDVERKKDVQAKPFRPSEFIELNDKAPK